MSYEATLRQHYRDVRQRLHIGRAGHTFDAVRMARELADASIESRERDLQQRIDDAVKAALDAAALAAPPPPIDILDPQPANMVPRWKTIIREVAEKHEVKVVDIISIRRDRKSCIARHEAMWRLKQETTMSFPQIGRRLGGRDHSTVIHGIHKHEERMAAK
jgi:chromosomal replication initiation ATPase DnaA